MTPPSLARYFLQRRGPVQNRENLKKTCRKPVDFVLRPKLRHACTRSSPTAGWAGHLPASSSRLATEGSSEMTGHDCSWMPTKPQSLDRAGFRFRRQPRVRHQFPDEISFLVRTNYEPRIHRVHDSMAWLAQLSMFLCWPCSSRTRTSASPRASGSWRCSASRDKPE